MIPARRPDHVIINNNKIKRKKERTCRTLDFADPANYRVKIKESKNKNKIDKVLDSAKEQRKQ